MDDTRRHTSFSQPNDSLLYFTMRPDHQIRDYAYTSESRLLNILSEVDGRKMAALALSFDLAEKIRVAICSGYKYRHMKDNSDKEKDNQQALKADLRLLEVEIEKLEQQVKSEATSEKQKDNEAKLLNTLKKREELGQKLKDGEAFHVSLEESTCNAHRLFESNWAAVDSDFRQVFENGGFVVESPSLRARSSNRQTPRPSQPKGYSGNGDYVSWERTQQVFPGLLQLAARDFQDARADFHTWHARFEKEAERAARHEEQPYHTEIDQAKFKAEFRMKWHERNAGFAKTRVEARETYDKAYKTAKLWRLNDCASWPSETWVSMGPEEEIRLSQERRDLTRTKNWVTSLANVRPDTSAMTPWAGPRFPSAEEMARIELLVPDYSGCHGPEPNTEFDAVVDQYDSVTRYLDSWPAPWDLPVGSTTNSENCSVKSRLFNLFHQDHNRRDEVCERYGYFEDRLNYGPPLGCAKLTRRNLEKHTDNCPAETPAAAQVPSYGLHDMQLLDRPDDNAAETGPQSRQHATKRDRLEAYNAQRKVKELRKNRGRERPMAMGRILPDLDRRFEDRRVEIMNLLKREDYQKEQDKKRGIKVDCDPYNDRNYRDFWSDAGSSTYYERCRDRRTDYRRRRNYMGKDERERWEKFMFTPEDKSSSSNSSERNSSRGRDNAKTSLSTNDDAASHAQKSADGKLVHDGKTGQPAIEGSGARQEMVPPLGVTQNDRPRSTVGQKKSVATPGKSASKFIEKPDASDPNRYREASPQQKQDRITQARDHSAVQKCGRDPDLNETSEKEPNTDHHGTKKSAKFMGTEKSARSVATEKGVKPVATEKSAEPVATEKSSKSVATNASAKSFRLESAMVSATEPSPNDNQPSNVSVIEGTEKPATVDYPRAESGGSRPRNDNLAENQDGHQKPKHAAKRKRADKDDGGEGIRPKRITRPRIPAVDSDIHVRYGTLTPRSRKTPPRPRSGGFTRALFAPPLPTQGPQDTTTRVMVPIYDGFAESPTAMDIDDEYDEEL